MNRSAPRRALLPLILLILFTTSADGHAQGYLPAPDNYVDLGNPEDERFHDLRGWGGLNAPLPKAYAADRTSRYQRLRSANSVKLFITQLGVRQSLTFRGEAGRCDDSFEVYVNSTGPLYTYRNKEASALTSFHQVTIEPSIITDAVVEVTFRNIAEDSCGHAAISFVSLEPLNEDARSRRPTLKAPRVSLESALQMAAGYAAAERIELKDYTLTEAALTSCYEDEQCWRLRWGRVEGTPSEYVEFKVSMNGAVSYSMSR